MPKYVIDTNVPIVANGRDETINIECRLRSVRLLQKAISVGTVYLDSDGVIQAEYRKHLSSNGQPGVGDRFYQAVLNSHPDRIVRVNIPKREDGEYAILPQPIIESGFDPSDRVFVAVAKKAKASVYNAVDSDWLEQQTVIEENGVPIVFICGCVQQEWRVSEG